jgi:hypothetical protein
MATARDIKGLRRFKWQGHVSRLPKAMLRWRDICVTALSTK